MDPKYYLVLSKEIPKRILKESLYNIQVLSRFFFQFYNDSINARINIDSKITLICCSNYACISFSCIVRYFRGLPPPGPPQQFQGWAFILCHSLGRSIELKGVILEGKNSKGGRGWVERSPAFPPAVGVVRVEVDGKCQRICRVTCHHSETFFLHILYFISPYFIMYLCVYTYAPLWLLNVYFSRHGSCHEFVFRK